MKGKFIVIEGLDGTGKTTQAAILKERLNRSGISAMLSAEPTEGEIGKMIRRAISGQGSYSSSVLAALFLADRIHHNLEPENGIQSTLSKGLSMISDRYYYSSMAYQGKGDDFDWVMRQNLDCADILRPDLCIFLDMAPEKCMERIFAGRDCTKLDVFENQEALRLIREDFHKVFSHLKERENILIIDADDDIENIADKIFGAGLSLYR